MESAFTFFTENTTQPQTVFLTNQLLAENAIDETINLGTICFKRKMAEQEEPAAQIKEAPS